MENKEQAFIGAILIILVIGLSYLYFINTKEIKSLKNGINILEQENDDLIDTIWDEREMQSYTLERTFEKDCMYRNFSFYTSDKGKSYCCKWIDDTKFCMDWLSVVSEVKITLNPYNFIYKQENSTVLIESNMGYEDEVKISLPNSIYDKCYYDFDEGYRGEHNLIELRCIDYD